MVLNFTKNDEFRKNRCENGISTVKNGMKHTCAQLLVNYIMLVWLQNLYRFAKVSKYFSYLFTTIKIIKIINYNTINM